jgi:hypothetical protein
MFDSPCLLRQRIRPVARSRPDGPAAGLEIDPSFAVQDDEFAWIVDRFTVLHPVSRR